MAEVDILLASYNGEKFIAEQIDSLLAQTFQEFRLLIRDDGSSDRTPEIIAEYERQYPGKIQVIHDEAVCKNPTKNFFQLMKYAEADYVMFCDQDDYWLPYKIQIELDCMKKAERENPDKPVLVCTGLEVADENLNSLERFINLGITKEDCRVTALFSKNCAYGCTEMLNRLLYESLGDCSMCELMHDHWVVLYAGACGIIRSVPMALILYRQHSNNYVGCRKIIRGGGGGG